MDAPVTGMDIGTKWVVGATIFTGVCVIAVYVMGEISKLGRLVIDKKRVTIVHYSNPDLSIHIEKILLKLVVENKSGYIKSLKDLRARFFDGDKFRSLFFTDELGELETFAPYDSKLLKYELVLVDNTDNEFNLLGYLDNGWYLELSYNINGSDIIDQFFDPSLKD